MPTPQHIADLIFKSLRKELTEQEGLELAEWRKESDQNDSLFKEVSDPERLVSMMGEYVQSQDKAWEKIVAKIPELAGRKVKGLPARKIAVAAALLIAIGSIFYFNGFKRPIQSFRPEETEFDGDISAGTNKAILTLSNGSTIRLGNSRPAIADIRSDNHIRSLDSNQISYANSQIDNHLVSYNILETPKGGQFQLSLPDGTRAWLNAASFIKYPIGFSGNMREIEMGGEIYFEVAKNPVMPFIVKVNGIQVKVLGTHFNVSAYSDEEIISTTVLEGSVLVSKAIHRATINPGDQARLVIGSSDIQVLHDVNTDAIVAWKNGRTLFQDASIPEIMRVVSRWYDVDVDYDGKIPQTKLSGGIARSASLLELFKVLQAYNIHLKKEGRKVTVIQ